jgi:CheY-like chemotaxis protein
MDHFQKAGTKTGDAKARIDKTKKILLIGGVKSAALLHRQETYRVFHCDTVFQAWSLVYQHRPHLIVLNLANSASDGLSTLQECRVLAGCVPIIVVAPAQLKRALAAALQHHVTAVIAASAIAQSVDKVLRSLV